MTKPSPPIPRLPVVCDCGWSTRRLPGQTVQCPKCGAMAAFQPEDGKE